MEIPHQVVIDKEGQPQSVIISWEHFQEIKSLLEEEESTPAQQSAFKSIAEMESFSDDLPEKTADHVEGGDYKSLRDLGVKLPTAKKRKKSADVDDEVANPDVAIDGVRLGKRIR